MIKHLQYRFIAVAMGSLLLVMIIVLGTINFVNFRTVQSDILVKLEYLTKINNTDETNRTERDYSENTWMDEFPYETRYFTTILTNDGTIVETDLAHISAIDTDRARKLSQKIYMKKSNIGSISTGRHVYAFLKTNTSDDKWLMVFLDCTDDFLAINNIMTLCMTIGLISYIAVFILVSIASKHVVQPAIDNIEKQKQFITNAGHELKTPLAIISANTEVIEMMSGANEWTISTMNQVKKLSSLVNNLIRLARMEESKENLVINKFNISKLADEIAVSFISIAQNEGKSIERNIAENIIMISDKNIIQELISILFDNAVKYCDSSGRITISLQQVMKSVRITISNDYSEGEKTDYRRFFDRFYRADMSHNSGKEGYGIGLSIAQEIVSVMKGKIAVDWKKGKIIFTVILPVK